MTKDLPVHQVGGSRHADPDSFCPSSRGRMRTERELILVNLLSSAQEEELFAAQRLLRSPVKFSDRLGGGGYIHPSGAATAQTELIADQH